MDSFPLYGGEVTLSFDEGRHVYTVGGVIKPSVTGIVKVLDKSGPLMGWVAKLASEEVAKSLKPGTALDEIEIKDLCDRIKKAHRKASQKPADIGQMAHDWFEAYGKAEISGTKKPEYPVNRMLQSCVDAFLDWVKKNEVKFIACEAKIYSRAHGYAGTMDLDGYVRDKRGVWDYKSSNAIYPEMGLQLAAYKQAREEEGHGPYEETGIVRVGKDGGEFEAKPFNEHEAHLSGFMACLALYRWMNRKAA